MAVHITAWGGHGPVTPAQPAGIAPESGLVGIVVGGGAVGTGPGRQGQGGAARRGVHGGRGTWLACDLGADIACGGQRCHSLAHGAGTVDIVVRTVVLVACQLGADAAGVGTSGFVAVRLVVVAAARFVVAMDRHSGR